MRKLRLLNLFFCAALSSINNLALASSEMKPKPVRAIHLVLRNLLVTDAKRYIDLAASASFNMLIIDPRDQVKFNKFPGKVLQNAWPIESFVAVVNYARIRGLDVIPEINLLTHQKHLLGDSYPEFMFDNETYDPRDKRVYDLIFPYLDELISLIHPQAIHIGHDEVRGAYKAKDYFFLVNSILPAELFRLDVVNVHDYLKKKNVATWMWGDMLISRDELPTMASSHLNGVGDYGHQLRNQLPKDIVICDWHYSDEQEEFPSISLFKTEGFRVVGATFRKSITVEKFSQYASKHGADGMIATTWFYVQRKEWDVVDRIIRESGEIFSKYFPNEK